MNKKPLIIIFLTVFIDLVGFGMIIPLSPYLAQQFGADAFQVGLLMAIYSAFQFLMAPVWGQLSDKWGRRPIILMSLFVAGGSHILFGLAHSLWLLFLARALAGIGGANISTAMAYISDITESKDRSKGMGLIGAAFGLGFVVGPALGGFFGQFGFAIPAFVAGGICLINFVMAYFFLSESLRPSSQSQKKTGRFQRLFKHFKTENVGSLMWVFFALTLALANIEAPLFLLVKDRFDWSLTEASYGFAFIGVLMAFTQGVLIRRLLPRFGEFRLIIAGALFFAIALALTGWSHELFYTAIAMVFLALGSGFYSPSLNGLVSIYSDPNEQGEVMGVMQSLSALSRIIGPPLGGWLYQAKGSAIPFYFGSILGGFAFVYVIFIFAKSKKKPGASRVHKDEQTVLRDLQSLTQFQLENIVNNAVPYKMFCLGSPDKTLEGPLFQKMEVLSGENPGEQVEAKVEEKAFPIILVGTDFPALRVLAVSLDQRGFKNVYYFGEVVSE